MSLDPMQLVRALQARQEEIDRMCEKAAAMDPGTRIAFAPPSVTEDGIVNDFMFLPHPKHEAPDGWTVMGPWQ